MVSIIEKCLEDYEDIHLNNHVPCNTGYGWPDQSSLLKFVLTTEGNVTESLTYDVPIGLSGKLVVICDYVVQAVVD